MSKFVMTSLIAKPIKTTQIFYMITLSTKFAFYNTLNSFFIFPRHILSKTCDKIKTYYDCTYKKCPTDQSIHNNERPTIPKIIAIPVPNHVRQFDIMKFFL